MPPPAGGGGTTPPPQACSASPMRCSTGVPKNQERNMTTIRAMAALWLTVFCLAAQAQLPDFTRLVEDQGNAVVNISTTQAVRRPTAALPQVPGIEDEK